MKSRDNILIELSLLNSTLTQANPENVYKVPVGYFEGLADKIMSRIKALNSSDISTELNDLFPELNAISGKSTYTVPAGYFDELEEKIMQHVRESSDYQSPQEELNTISPFLSGLKKQNPYTVPSGYFEKISKKKTAVKVISITSQKWFRYAAAAVVIVTISSVAIFYINKNATGPSNENNAWAKIEKQVKNMSDEEIKDFVEFNDAGLTSIENTGLLPVKKEEVRELLNDVSDNELKNFLEQTSDGVHDILMLN